MTWTRASTAAGIVGLVLASVSGCGDDSDEDVDTASVDSIQYTVIGPSTPPQFHQEYVVEITAEEATIRVGTYGTVDGSEEPAGTATVTVTDEVWADLVDGAGSLPSEAGDDGCTGGSTLTVEVERDDGSTSSTEVYGCSENSDDLADELEDLFEPVLSQFDLDELDPRD
ncbi:hypothetical protein [Aeromicrobium sp. Leaf350]|uniref:hypothetical protein n=1 Tax=Aeromicrobium sp. Leaf350 TaxID=2876565 RepID=UPI001E65C4E3|nr:hypothetical protein [Aeromicrobium sp. Leaf350]